MSSQTVCVRLSRLVLLISVFAFGGFAQGQTYVQPASPLLNATSWHGSYAVATRCVAIRYGGFRTGATVASVSFNALETVPYTIIGRDNVRFESRAGLFTFFEEEPRDKYQVISRGIRLSYTHDPDAEDWKEKLMDALEEAAEEAAPVPAVPPTAELELNINISGISR